MLIERIKIKLMYALILIFIFPVSPSFNGWFPLNTCSNITLVWMEPFEPSGGYSGIISYLKKNEPSVVS